MQSLYLAKARSEAGLNNFSHGVYFEINEEDNDKFILYQGNSYATRDQNFDREIAINSSLIITINIAGNEVNFLKGIGLPSATGTIEIIHQTTKETRHINVNNLGIIEKS
jgi:hypothetical protein